MPQPSASGTVKKVLSGVTIVVRGIPEDGWAPERTITLRHIIVPKLERRVAEGAEPFAWESREFLRKMLVGQEVTFAVDYKAPASGREYGNVYLGKGDNQVNLAEALVSEGLVEVRQDTNRPNDEYLQKLNKLQAAAKAAGKGKWSDNAKDHVRDVKWALENPRNLVNQFRKKRVKAVIEHVRDGSTVRAFLLPSFQYVTVMISGIKVDAPLIRLGKDGRVVDAQPLAKEAKCFTEKWLLQRDVEIVLETVDTNQNLVGSIIHPNGNFAELLLKAGYAKCVDWSIKTVSGGPEKLRAAEREAKEKKLRIWKNYEKTSQVINSSSQTFQNVAVVAKDPNVPPTAPESKNGESPIVGVQDLKKRGRVVECLYDYQNQRFPAGLDRMSCFQRLMAKLMTHGDTVYVKFVIDKDKEFDKDGFWKKLSWKENIDILHVSAEEKQSADGKLIEKMKKFAQLRDPKGTVVVLISSDGDLAPMMKILRDAGFEVHVYHGAEPNKDLLQLGNCFMINDLYANLKKQKKKNKKKATRPNITKASTIAEKDSDTQREVRRVKDGGSVSSAVSRKTAAESQSFTTTRYSTRVIKQSEFNMMEQQGQEDA